MKVEHRGRRRLVYATVEVDSLAPGVVLLAWVGGEGEWPTPEGPAHLAMASRRAGLSTPCGGVLPWDHKAIDAHGLRVAVQLMDVAGRTSELVYLEGRAPPGWEPSVGWIVPTEE